MVYEGHIRGGVVVLATDEPPAEGTRVHIVPIEEPPARGFNAGEGDWRGWLDRVGEVHRDILARRGGPLPDSTAEIAEDRMRDD